MSRLRLYCPEGSSSFDAPRILSFAFYAPLIRAERALAKSRGPAVPVVDHEASSAPQGVVAVIRRDGERVKVSGAPKLFVRRFDLAGE